MNESATVESDGQPAPVDLKKRFRDRWRQVLFGAVISIAGLLFVAQEVQWREFVEVLRSTDIAWVCAAFVVRFGSVLFRGIRWQVELSAVQNAPVKATTGGVALSSFFNIIIPLKLGELLRIGYGRSKNPHIKTGQMVGSIAIERLLDMVIIVALVFSCWSAASAMPGLKGAASLLSGATLAGFGFVISTRLQAQLVSFLSARKRLAASVLSVLQGGAVVRNARLLFMALFWTTAAWLADAAALYCCLNALGLGMTFDMAIIVTVVMAVGLLAPAAPIQIGTHQALSVFLLGMFGAGEASAVATSVVMQSVTLSAFALSAGAVLWRERHPMTMLTALSLTNQTGNCTTTPEREALRK